MTKPSTQVAARALVPVVATSLMLACSTPAPEIESSDSGAAGTSANHDAAPDRHADVQSPIDSGPDAAQPVWDPVWHDTKPKDWPIAPKAHPDGCGQGCVVGLDIVPLNGASGTHFRSSLQGLVTMDLDRGLLGYSRFDDEHTLILHADPMNPRKDGYVVPYIYGKLASVVWISDKNTGGQVRVIHLDSGETKIAYQYVRHEDYDLGVSFTALNDKYVFWERGAQGFMSLNMQTGQRRTLNHTECEDWFATPTGLFCDKSPMAFVHQDTGKVTSLDPGGALQVDGNITLQRDEVTWIDYRDPPGPGSSFMGKRSGGEVYAHNLLTHKTTRITNDSPAKPTAKAYPAIGKQLIVWKQSPKDYDQNPEWAQFVYAAARDIIVLDRKTGKRCRIHSDLAKYFTHMVVRGRRVYGDMSYVVGLDVDDPAIGCVAE